MDIDFVKLEDLRALTNWEDSPIGSVLAVTLEKPGKGVDEAELLIVARCDVQQPELKGRTWAICLDGDKKGEVLGVEQLNASPAFDISALVEFGVKNPKGWLHLHNETHIGLLFAQGDELVLKGHIAPAYETYVTLTQGKRGDAVEKMVYPAVCLGEISVRMKG